MSAFAARANGGRSEGGRPPRDLSALGGRDRAQEFRKAFRHTKVVRFLKAALPLFALSVLGLYFLPYFLRVSVDNGKGTATVKAITLKEGALKMINPRVQGVNDSKGVYDLTADSATQVSRNADVMFLDKVRGKLTSAEGNVSTLKAPNGLYNNKNEEMTFENGAFVTREPGLTAEFKTATAYMKQNLVVSNTPVIVHLHESTINADKMTLYSAENRVIFEGNVRTHVVRAQPEGTQESGTAAPSDAPIRVETSVQGAWQTGTR